MRPRNWLGALSKPATSETTSSDIDPDAMELMRIELAEAAKATNLGPGTVQ
jgi:hypothetical protein